MTITRHRRPRLTRPDEMPAPVADDLSAHVLTEAIDTLSALRTAYWLGDPAVHLHALASPRNPAQDHLPDAGPRARDQGLTWAEIGQLPGPVPHGPRPSAPNLQRTDRAPLDPAGDPKIATEGAHEQRHPARARST